MTKMMDTTLCETFLVMAILPPTVKKTTIHIGGVFASRRPAAVHTVLGSCVSACLFEPGTGIGGMNHFMLPEGSLDEGLPTRYGVHAMEVLINRLMKLGADRSQLRAKVFGGGRVLRMANSFLAVPEQNIWFIKKFLLTEGIPILGQRLGGIHPLQVYFFTHTGKVLVRPLRSERAKDIAAAEERYSVEVIKQVSQAQTDNVTLF
jgi:chemotaxis receptor (MCP) glutamine deamidase CheD